LKLEVIKNYIPPKNSPVGKVLKIAEHGISSPFHSQYLKMDRPPSVCDVKSVKSRQGKLVYHNAENMLS
jgi:hypothetical protein